MPVTPTGPLSLPLHYLRLTLADVTAFNEGRRSVSDDIETILATAAAMEQSDQ